MSSREMSVLDTELLVLEHIQVGRTHSCTTGHLHLQGYCAWRLPYDRCYPELAGEFGQIGRKNPLMRNTWLTRTMSHFQFTGAKDGAMLGWRHGSSSKVSA
jgi:hypothetical protein